MPGAHENSSFSDLIHEDHNSLKELKISTHVPLSSSASISPTLQLERLEDDSLTRNVFDALDEEMGLDLKLLECQSSEHDHCLQSSRPSFLENRQNIPLSNRDSCLSDRALESPTVPTRTSSLIIQTKLSAHSPASLISPRLSPSPTHNHPRTCSVASVPSLSSPLATETPISLSSSSPCSHHPSRKSDSSLKRISKTGSWIENHPPGSMTIITRFKAKEPTPFPFWKKVQDQVKKTLSPSGSNVPFLNANESPTRTFVGSSFWHSLSPISSGASGKIPMQAYFSANDGEDVFLPTYPGLEYESIGTEQQPLPKQQPVKLPRLDLSTHQQHACDDIVDLYTP